MEQVMSILGYIRDHFWLIIIVIAGYALFAAVRKTTDSEERAARLAANIERMQKDRRELQTKYEELTGKKEQ